MVPPAAVMTVVHGLVAPQPPPVQPVKVALLEGVAVRVTLAPGEKRSEQSAPQAMPGPDTEPGPTTAMVEGHRAVGEPTWRRLCEARQLLVSLTSTT